MSGCRGGVAVAVGAAVTGYAVGPSLYCGHCHYCKRARGNRAGELTAAGLLDPAVFVSHPFPLDAYAEALQQFRAGVGRKILIEP